MRLRNEWLLLLTVTAIAAGIRFYRLADYPPGLHYDEAFHHVFALEIMDGYRPLYFPENNGDDAMFPYIIALLFRAVGVTTIGGRIISAIAGTLTVPALWWLTQELFADWDVSRRTAVSAVSAFVLATLQWHITASRTGIQPALVPWLLVPMMAALWRGLRTGRWGWFAAAGVLLGAAQYTYMAARVIPLLVIFLGVWLLLFQPSRFRQRWRGFLLCAVVSLVVFVPLASYFIAHPQWFTFRAGQTTHFTLGPGSDSPMQELWKNVVRTLSAFSFRGDMDVIRNLPGRPILDIYQSASFLLGIGVCVWHFRRPAYATLLAWVAVMLLPTILTEGAPHYTRGLGAAPATAVLVGLGVVTAWEGAGRLAGRWQPRARRTVGKIAGTALSLGLIASAVGHGYAYFARWGSLPELYQPYDVGLLAATRELRTRLPSAEVYLSPISVGHPIPRFLLWGQPGARSYDGRYTLVLPPPLDRPAEYVIIPSIDDRSLSRLQRAFPQGQIVATGAPRRGVPYYEVYHVPAGSEPSVNPQHRLRVAWREQIGLIGYDLDKARYQPSDVIKMTLYFRSLDPVEESFTVFTHLLGPVRPGTDSPVWSGWDQEPGKASYPTSAWQPGEVVVDEYALTIPSDAPAGEYSLEVGLYQLQTMERLSVSTSDVEAGVDYVIVSQIVVDAAR
jgi:4-amino-4-deoxy-L-arabinose transferase-like glycosyltransferase